jgi:hypothetical protein
LASYGKLPLSFEANKGQTNPQVKFMSCGGGYTTFLTADEAVLVLRKSSVVSGQSSVGTRQNPGVAPTFRSAYAGLKSGATTSVDNPATDHGPLTTDSVLRMKLVGANTGAAVTGVDELPGRSNYFIGNDPKKWRTNVPSYTRVKYEGVYPGVDLVYYGNQRQLEYDFVVAPGADPGAIRFALSGGPEVGSRQSAVGSGSQNQRVPQSEIQNLKSQIGPSGDLVVKIDGNEMRFHKPVIYQTKSAGNRQSSIDNRQLLQGRYTLDAQNQVGFKVASYDPTRPLIIDPYLSYSTYLGGSGADYGNGIAVDREGNAYVTGYTTSTNFPTTNPIQATNKATPTTGSGTAFVTKLNSTGSALVYSTYLGGSTIDEGLAIAVDAAGNATVAGGTGSSDFPTVNPLQATCGTCSGGYPTGFVAKLNTAGSALVYSTFLGGSGYDEVDGIALDAAGNAYLTGYTTSSDFPTANPLQATCGSCPLYEDAFVAKLNPAGSALVYSTYLGGSSSDLANGIAVDSSGNAYVTGSTYSTDFPTANPFQATNKANLTTGLGTAFVAKLNSTGSALVYSTYLGGSDSDSGLGIAVDSSGSAYVTGFTASTDFPTVDPLQATYGGGSSDAFVTEFNPAGSALVYSTFLGGSGYDVGTSIAVSTAGSVPVYSSPSQPLPKPEPVVVVPSMAAITGATNSDNFPNFPRLGGIEDYCSACELGDTNVFFAELYPGGVLRYSTYLGGSGADFGDGIVVDGADNAYVTGWTASTNYPTTSSALQLDFNGGETDGLVSKIGLAFLPEVSISPWHLLFLDQPYGTTSLPITITLRSVGSAPLAITEIKITTSKNFSQWNTCPRSVPLPSGGYCVIEVYFKPEDVGRLFGTLTIEDDAAYAPDPQTVDLVGTVPY